MTIRGSEGQEEFHHDFVVETRIGQHLFRGIGQEIVLVVEAQFAFQQPGGKSDRDAARGAVGVEVLDRRAAEDQRQVVGIIPADHRRDELDGAPALDRLREDGVDGSQIHPVARRGREGQPAARIFALDAPGAFHIAQLTTRHREWFAEGGVAGVVVAREAESAQHGARIDPGAGHEVHRLAPDGVVDARTVEDAGLDVDRHAGVVGVLGNHADVTGAEVAARDHTVAQLVVAAHVGGDEGRGGEVVVRRAPVQLRVEAVELLAEGYLEVTGHEGAVGVEHAELAVGVEVDLKLVLEVGRNGALDADAGIRNVEPDLALLRVGLETRLEQAEDGRQVGAFALFLSEQGVAAA